MINKRGYFGIGVECMKMDVNYGGIYRSAYLLGASYIFLIAPRFKVQSSDTYKTNRHIPLYVYGTCDEFKRNTPYGCKIVGVEIADSINPTPLKEFKHPQQCCYLLGSEDNGLSKVAIGACHEFISIECGSMNVATAGSIIMYDRMITK